MQAFRDSRPRVATPPIDRTDETTQVARWPLREDARVTGVKSKRDSWIDLLLTDSLGRPLAGAPYSVHEGPRPWKQDCLHGHLDQGGRVSLRWHPEGLSFFVGYRSLLLQSGPTEGALRTRNRLTCLGYDAGPPDSALDSDRASRALAALIEHAHHDTDSSVALDADPESVLEDWVRGRIGVGEPASAG